MNDLWAEDIVIETFRTPVAILREQASLLGQKTQNLVLAEVDSSLGSNFQHRFNITAPALGSYSYRLFTVSHPMDLYPLNVDLDSDICYELGLFFKPAPVKRISIEDEAEFLKLLDRILKAERTKYIIRTLLSQISG